MTPFASGILAAANDNLALGVTGAGGVAVQVLGTWSGTITFECSLDGVTYTTLSVTPPNSTTAVTTATANGIWLASIAGVRQVRARMSSFSSGSASILIQGVQPAPSLGGGGGSGSSGAVTIADGDDAALGATTAAAISSDTTGTISGKLRGVVKILANVWNSTTARLKAETENQLDYDTGAGTVGQSLIGFALPASGGPVAGGTSTNPLRMAAVPAALTASAPDSASVGASSGQVVAANSSRKGLVLTFIPGGSATIITFGFGATAVLGKGIVLLPYGTYRMTEFDFTTGAVNAIGDATGGSLAIQEFA